MAKPPLEHPDADGERRDRGRVREDVPDGSRQGRQQGISVRSDGDGGNDRGCRRNRRHDQRDDHDKAEDVELTHALQFSHLLSGSQSSPRGTARNLW